MVEPIEASVRDELIQRMQKAQAEFDALSPEEKEKARRKIQRRLRKRMKETAAESARLRDASRIDPLVMLEPITL